MKDEVLEGWISEKIDPGLGGNISQSGSERSGQGEGEGEGRADGHGRESKGGELEVRHPEGEKKPS